MRASTAAWLGLALLAGLGLAAAPVVTEGALFSTAHHEWRVEVAADGEAAWSIEVPSLAAGGASARDLDALLARLRVARGDATVERDETSLRIDGRGDASVVARREFWGMRSAPFGDWRATRDDAARLDADGPRRLVVTWSLDLVASGGHTCGGSGSWSAELAPGERGTLATPAMTWEGQRREPLSTAAPPVPMWCH